MKEVVGFKEYHICEDGRVFSMKKNRYLLPRVDRHGYSYVTLTKGDGKSVYKSIHRLVAIAFVPNPDNKPQVNHKDCNKRNNHVSNLEWVTQLENNIHTISMNRRPRCHNRLRGK